MTARDLAKRLNARRSGKQWSAQCRAHDDRNASLSIGEENGKILLHCHAGCTLEAICAALRIEPAQLFSESGRQATRHVAAEYNYCDEAGEVLYQVVRRVPKDFRQRQPDGSGGWTWNLHGVRRVLYRLPEVLQAEHVFIVEGEKDVDTARKLGLVATCNVGGAGKWRAEYSVVLQDKDVTIIPDADAVGRNHAQAVAASLKGRAASIRVVELPAKDLTAWVELGGTREALLTEIERTPLEPNRATKPMPEPADTERVDIITAALDAIGGVGRYATARETFRALCIALQRLRGSKSVVLPVEKIAAAFRRHHTLISHLRIQGVVEGWLKLDRPAIPHRQAATFFVDLTDTSPLGVSLKEETFQPPRNTPSHFTYSETPQPESLVRHPHLSEIPVLSEIPAQSGSYGLKGDV